MSERNSKAAFVPYPGAMGVEIERAQGAWLFAKGGRRILDAAGGSESMVQPCGSPGSIT